MDIIKNSEAINLLGLSQKNLEDFFKTIEEKPFRAVQVMKWIHQRGISDFSKMVILTILKNSLGAKKTTKIRKYRKGLNMICFDPYW